MYRPLACLWVATVGLSGTAIPVGAYDAVYTAGASATASTTETLTIEGLHAIGDGATPDDALDVLYKLNRATLALFPVQKRFLVGLGASNDRYFARDTVVKEPTFSYGGKTYVSRLPHKLTSNSLGQIDLEYSLEPGHVINHVITGFKTMISARLVGPGLDSTTYYAANRGVSTGYLRITAPGTYRYQIRSLTGKPFSMTVTSYNHNLQDVQDAGNGSFVTSTFRSDGPDYWKYRVLMNAGESIKIYHTFDNYTRTLVGRYGELAATGGLRQELNYTAKYSGYRYIFTSPSAGYKGGKDSFYISIKSNAKPNRDSDLEDDRAAEPIVFTEVERRLPGRR